MKHARTSTILLALVALSLLASGCIITTDAAPFAPFGSEVTVSGEWDVDGAAPTLSSCGDIVTIRALVCETSSGANCLANTRLTFSCAAGAFDTRPTPILVSGTYYVVWEALNSSGARLQASQPALLSAFGSHVVFPIPDFAPGATAFDPSGTAVSLDGIWDVNGAAPTVQSCGDIATVRVVICQNAAATICWTSAALTFPCSDGGFDTRPTRVLAAGSYHSLWEALDSNGNVLQETTPLPLVVNTHATLITPDFDGALPPTSLTVQFRFQDAPQSTQYLTCTGAMVASNQFTYTLHEGSGVSAPAISGPTNQLCSQGSSVLFSDNASYTFDGEPYTVSFSASENVSGCVSTWSGICTFSLTVGSANTVTCDATVVSTGSCGAP